MQEPRNNFQYLLNSLSLTARWVIGAVLIVGVAVLAIVVYALRGNRIDIASHATTTLSPTQIQHIRNIGQWETLAISDEEIIDTTRYGFFGDDHLARIYYGTLRLGIDLSLTDQRHIEVVGDSISMQLPPVQLLDENFIDEAHTRPFYESGKWSHADRERLYLRAVATMKQRCLTPENLNTARQNAVSQMTHLLRAMGFQRIHVETAPPHD